MKRFVFHDYDFIVLFGVAFLFLISLASVIGDRKGAGSHTYNVNVAYDRMLGQKKSNACISRHVQESTKISRNVALVLI